MAANPLSSFTSKTLNSYYHTKILSDYPSSNRLLLSLFRQPNLSHMSVKQLIAWGELFDQESSTIRVAAGRLVKQGFLLAHKRGHYTVGATDKTISQLAASWRYSEDQVTDWHGGWISIFTAHIGPTTKQNIRIRERAFRLLGFKPYERNLWCRPDNLRESADSTFARLVKIGLEDTAIMMKVVQFNQDSATNPMSLWSPLELNINYKLLASMLDRSAKRLNDIDVIQATRESFLIGDHVIRTINQDPLLPEEMVDVSKRQKLLAAMIEYDRVCHPIWNKFINHF